MSEYIRHDMDVHIDAEDIRTKYMNVFLPDLGNMTITYRTDFSDSDEAHVFISVDFDTDKIIVIDKNGIDKRVE